MTIRKRFQFFLNNAGYATPPGRAACALFLAKSEAWREEQEADEKLRIRWEHDELPYEMGDAETKHPDEVLCCLVETRCGECERWQVAASLSGIGDPSREYARVVEAELCSELAEVN